MSLRVDGCAYHRTPHTHAVEQCDAPIPRSRMGWRHGRKKRSPSECERSDRGGGRLGAQGRVFTDNEVRQLLRAAVELAGTQVAFAKRHGLDPHAPQSGLKRKKPGQWLTAEVSRTSQSIHARAGRRSGQNGRSALHCSGVTSRRGLIRDCLPLQRGPEKWTWFPACAKPRQRLCIRVEASAGEGSSEKIMLKQ